MQQIKLPAGERLGKFDPRLLRQVVPVFGGGKHDAGFSAAPAVVENGERNAAQRLHAGFQQPQVIGPLVGPAAPAVVGRLIGKCGIGARREIERPDVRRGEPSGQQGGEENECKNAHVEPSSCLLFLQVHWESITQVHFKIQSVPGIFLRKIS